MTINTGDRKGQKNFNFMGNDLIATCSPYHCLYHAPNTHLPFLQSFPSEHIVYLVPCDTLLSLPGGCIPCSPRWDEIQVHAISQKAKVFTLVQQWHFTSRSNDSIIFNIARVTLLLDGESCTQCISKKLSTSQKQKNLYWVHWSQLSKVNFWSFYLWVVKSSKGLAFWQGDSAHRKWSPVDFELKALQSWGIQRYQSLLDKASAIA